MPLALLPGMPRSTLPPQKRQRKSLICELEGNDPGLGAILRLTQPSPHKPTFFRSVAQKTSNAVGRPWAFAAALGVVLAWATLGPIFHYSDTWQLVINTSTTIVTFLMVFLIQSAQNRDTEALRLKMDALILAFHNVSNVFVDIENFDDDELEQLRQKFRTIAATPEKQPAAKARALEAKEQV